MTRISHTSDLGKGGEMQQHPERIVHARGSAAHRHDPDARSGGKARRDAAAIGFLMDAFAHLKAIGHCRGSKVILDRAGLPGMAKRRDWAREPDVRDLA